MFEGGEKKKEGGEFYVWSLLVIVYRSCYSSCQGMVWRSCWSKCLQGCIEKHFCSFKHFASLMCIASYTHLVLCRCYGLSVFICKGAGSHQLKKSWCSSSCKVCFWRQRRELCFSCAVAQGSNLCCRLIKHFRGDVIWKAQTKFGP